MNPYDFVPVDWQHPPVRRRPPVGHRNLNELHGTVECKITAETPLFILNPSAEKNSDILLKFLQNSEGEYFIQGSSLKGMLRNVVETVGPGCWLLFDGKYKGGNGEQKNYIEKLPKGFSKCNNLEKLCPACRLFGIVNGKDVHYQGRVGVDDAVCINVVPHDPVHTIILMNPKPHHEAWYLDGDKVAGRKYYFHQQEISTLRNAVEYNKYIAPLGRGSAFTFKVVFKGLDNKEFALLLYALFLGEDMRHKIGYAKPAGFGSVKIEPVRMEMIDFRSRYKNGAGPQVFVDNDLTAYIDKMTAVYRTKDSITMNALRRIWKWPPDYQRCSYPDRGWFNKNSMAPISET